VFTTLQCSNVCNVLQKVQKCAKSTMEEPHNNATQCTQEAWTADDDMDGCAPALSDAAPAPTTVFGIYHGFMTRVADHVLSTGMGDKRCMYGAMRRDPPASPDTFLPKFGLTVGEIASLLVL
jgi:hypothetical protein